MHLIWLLIPDKLRRFFPDKILIFHSRMRVIDQIELLQRYQIN